MKRLCATLPLLLLLSLAAQAQAQAVFRSVGPDGRVTFSDQPPPGGTGGAGGAASSASGRAAAGGGAPALPYTLQQLSQRFPVVLYTGAPCAPCDSGRELLRARGVPYTERTVTTEDDALALKRLAGERTLPLLTIGAQQLRGFSASQWQQYLDAAGYPATSALPAGWHPPAPAPLAPRPAAPPAAAAPSAPETASAPPPAPATREPATRNNPAGIRF